VTSGFAAVELDRVLRLVGSFARSEAGRKEVLATLPRFDAAEGSRVFALASDVERFVAAHGALGFFGLDAAALLQGDAPAADARDLAHLVGLVRGIVDTRAEVLAAAAPGSALAALAAALPPLHPLLAFCDLRLAPDGEILDSASPALAQARAARERSRLQIAAALDEVRRRHREVVDPFTVRRDRYCVPVAVGERAAVPGLVLDVSASGATVFVEPFALVDLNNALAEAIARQREEEERVLREVAAAIARRREELLAGAAALAELDAFQARTLFGRATGGILLAPGSGARIRLLQARHVLLDPALARLREDTLGEAGNTRPVVPLDLDLPADARLVLLSGPNAGGKTVALKTLGLTTLMVHSGIPVLADPDSELPPFSGVWCHIGDEQDLLSDLSTFSGAMHATARLLADADGDTLVLYDELGAGTDPEEGAALAAAILEELARRRCWTLATAHLATVAAHVERIPGAVNAAMGYDEASGRPTYLLRMGAPGSSRGLAIARRCGIPEAVLARARTLLSNAFLALDSYLARLHEETAALARERDRLTALEAAAAAARAAADAEGERLAAAAAEMRARLAGERDRLRQRADEQLRTALAELGRARERGEFPSKKRFVAARRIALSLGGEEAAAADAPAPVAGAVVRVRSLGGEGTVRAVAGSRVEVAVGGKRVWVEAAACEPVAAPAAPRAAVLAVASSGEAPASELKLIGLARDEAREELERFVDRALLAGVRRIRVVHGHGSGTLRLMVREYLAAHPAVATLSHPPQQRGGTGVTEAELE
jgi:DNA mismatch repair protein MutS2